MKPFLVAATLLLLPGCAWLNLQAHYAPAASQARLDPVLRDELLAMAEVDQQARAGVNSDHTMAVDRKHTARMKAIVEAHGWPGRSLVGEDGANAAWLLVQHADQDPAFQARCLELLEAAAGAGEATWREVAYLTDRVRVAQDKPQVYGTQFTMIAGKAQPHPIEAPEGLDARRAKAGLEPFSAYQARLLERAAARAPKAPELRDKLLAAYEASQNALSADFQAYLASPARRERLAWTRALVERQGWPGRTQVGEDGDDALLHLILEERQDLVFLRRCLALVESAHRQGETSGRRVATLTDSILVAEGKPQRYGTEFVMGEDGIEPYPIEDEAHVDERRKALGLGPLAESLATMRRLNPGK